MRKLQEQVTEFHQRMGQPIGGRPMLIDPERVRLRLRLIFEEALELAEALGSDGLMASLTGEIAEKINRDTFSGSASLIEAADALADVSYVVAGTAVEMGIPLGAVCDEVHRSNMTKMPGHLRADGKILKGPAFDPPRIYEVLGLAEWKLREGMT